MVRAMYILVGLLVLYWSCKRESPKVKIMVSYPHTYDSFSHYYLGKVIVENQTDTLIYIPSSRDSSYYLMEGRKISRFKNEGSSVGIADYYATVDLPIPPHRKIELLVGIEQLENFDTVEYYFKYYLDTSFNQIRYASTTFLVKDSTYYFLRDTVVARNYKSIE